jgi:hypothetical protein
VVLKRGVWNGHAVTAEVVDGEVAADQKRWQQIAACRRALPAANMWLMINRQGISSMM